MFFSGLAGLILSLSFPKPGVYFLAWISFIPLFFVARDLTPSKGFLAGFCFGLVHFLSLLYWVVYTLHTYGYLPLFLCVPILLLLVFYLSLYPAIFTLLLCKFCKRPSYLLIVTPCLWVALEYIRSIALTGFPWELLGYSQHNFSALIQFSDITGVYGISFLVMLVNAGLFILCLNLTGKTWQNNGIKRPLALCHLAVAASCFALVCVYGVIRTKQVENWVSHAKTLTVSVIQGNIDQSVKWDNAYQKHTLTKYSGLSLRAAVDKPDLIVWPETAAPFYYDHNASLVHLLTQTIAQTGAEFVIGFPSYEHRQNRFQFYNSAFVFDGKGQLADAYSKVHLVPFGEYVPLKRFLPFINKLTEQSGDFYAGQKGETVDLESGHKLGIQICFEVIFQNLCRSMVNNKAELLVNITNDAWFSDSSAPYQHFSMVKFRAVENRRAVARSANTGISGFISPTGKALGLTGLYTDAYRTQSLPLLNQRSFYTRYGDWIVVFCALVLAAAWIAGRVYRKGQSHENP